MQQLPSNVILMVTLTWAEAATRGSCWRARKSPGVWLLPRLPVPLLLRLHAQRPSRPATVRFARRRVRALRLRLLLLLLLPLRLLPPGRVRAFLRGQRSRQVLRTVASRGIPPSPSASSRCGSRRTPWMKKTGSARPCSLSVVLRTASAAAEAATWAALAAAGATQGPDVAWAVRRGAKTRGRGPGPGPPYCRRSALEATCAQRPPRW